MIEYTLRKRILIEMSILFIGSIILFGILVSQAFENRDLFSDYAFLIIFISFLVIFGIYDFITIEYIREDIGKKIRINPKLRELHIEKNGVIKIINRGDVFKSYLVESRNNWNNRNPFINHKYLALLLKNGDLIIVTNLLADPNNILNSLKINYSLIKTTLPNLDYKLGSGFLTKSEYDKKVAEFYHNFKGKTIEELTEITKNGHIYERYAIESARKLLKEME